MNGSVCRTRLSYFRPTTVVRKPLATGGQKRKGTTTGGFSRAIFGHGTSTRSTAQPPTDRNAKIWITGRWNGRDRSVGGRTCPSTRDIWTSHDSARARGPTLPCNGTPGTCFPESARSTSELGRGDLLHRVLVTQTFLNSRSSACRVG